MTRAMVWGCAAALALAAGLAMAQKTKTGSEGSAPGAAHNLITPDQLKWGPPAPGLPPGAQMAVIDGDPTQAVHWAVRLRAPDGYTIKPHWHSKDEHITVLSGTFAMGTGEQMNPTLLHDLAPGSYTSIPATHRHFATMHGETVIQIDGMGPFDIHYVNQMDDPRMKRSSR